MLHAFLMVTHIESIVGAISENDTLIAELDGENHAHNDLQDLKFEQILAGNKNGLVLVHNHLFLTNSTSLTII